MIHEQPRQPASQPARLKRPAAAGKHGSCTGYDANPAPPTLTVAAFNRKRHLRSLLHTSSPTLPHPHRRETLVAEARALTEVCITSPICKSHTRQVCQSASVCVCVCLSCLSSAAHMQAHYECDACMPMLSSKEQHFFAQSFTHTHGRHADRFNTTNAHPSIGSVWRTAVTAMHALQPCSLPVTIGWIWQARPSDLPDPVCRLALLFVIRLVVRKLALSLSSCGLRQTFNWQARRPKS